MKFHSKTDPIAHARRMQPDGTPVVKFGRYTYIRADFEATVSHMIPFLQKLAAIKRRWDRPQDLRLRSRCMAIQFDPDAAKRIHETADAYACEVWNLTWKQLYEVTMFLLDTGVIWPEEK